MAANNTKLNEILENYINIPQELKNTPRWIVWRKVNNENNEKFQKKPFQSNKPNFYSSFKKSSDWSTFKDAVNAVNKKKADGIGFALFDEYILIDLDTYKTDKVNKGNHEKLLNDTKGKTYVEKSQSGNGYHILFKGATEHDFKQWSGIDYFSDGFVYLTGDVVGQDCISSELDIPRFLEEKHNAHKSENTTPVGIQGECPKPIGEIIKLIKSKEKSKQLFESSHEQHFDYPSPSEADQALFTIAAYWTHNDPEMMLAVMRNSNRYREEKENRYIKHDIPGAILLQDKLANYDKGKKIKSSNGGIIEVDGYNPIQWLAYGYLIDANLTILAGKQGCGKSSFCAWLAAQLTTGGSWPVSGEQLPVCNVGWLTAEEEAGQEIFARLKINDADISRVHHLEPQITERGIKRMLDLAKDDDYVNRIITSNNIKLLIVDTVTSFGGDRNMNSNSEIRNQLLTLKTLAVNTNCAILGLAHINKSTEGDFMDAIQGASAYTQVPRLVLGLIKASAFKGDDIHYIGPVKSNLARLDSVLKYRCSYKHIEEDQKNSFAHLTFEKDYQSGEINDVWNSLKEQQRATKKFVDVSILSELIINFLKSKNKPIEKKIIEAAIEREIEKTGRKFSAYKSNRVFSLLQAEGKIKKIKKGRTRLYEYIN